MKYILGAFILISALSGCKKDEKTAEEAQNEILQYIDQHDLDAKATGSGLYYVVEKEGFGDNPRATSDVRVKYKGYLTNGNVFDESEDYGALFNLQTVIEGWTEGIQLFKPGGKGILLIPPALGYGSKDSEDIPAYSVLIFEIELKQVY